MIPNRSVPRPFRVPWYPATPLLFCAACAFMLYSSLRYSATLGGRAAWLGVILLLLGIPFALASVRRGRIVPPADPAQAGAR